MNEPESPQASVRSKRFAVRLVIAFVVSAALPVLAFSVLTYLSTRAQLEEEAGTALRREAKDAAMSVLERLVIGEARLRTLAAESGESRHEGRRAIFASVVSVPLAEADVGAADREKILADEALLDLVEAPSALAVRLSIHREGRLVSGIFAPAYLFAPERLGPGESYWVTDERDRLVFGVEPDAEGLLDPMSRAPIEGAELRVPTDLALQRGGDGIAVVWPLFLKSPYGLSGLRVGVARAKDSVLLPLRDFSRIFYVTMGATLLLSASLALQQIRRRVGPLEALTAAVHRVEAGELGARVGIESGDEFEMLGDAFDAMSVRLRDYFDAVQHLRLTAESLLSSATPEDVGNVVVPSLLSLTPSLNVALFVADGTDVEASETVREVVIDRAIAGACDDPAAARGRAIFAARALDLEEPALFLRIEGEASEAWAAFDRAYGGRAESLLVIPLTAARGEVHGVLLVTFDRESAQVDLSDDALRPVFVIAAQAGAALSHVRLLESLRSLFEGVIDLTVDAIDEKSPYTGDHCRRVPILTEMIADAVCDDDSGSFKDFCFSEEERYELKIAALLHDCGKVSTPVHVMDKATKLETIIDRIEVIRLRAEILRRDFALARAGGSGGTLVPHDGPSEQDLVEALDFIASANVGGEFMSDEAIRRLDEIAERFVWTDAEGGERSLVTADEVRNLKIKRGTLNDDERQEIESHVVTTMRLLERLPFPKSMRNVPAIAGAHHERVDGTGYPLGLGGENLSLQGRILGLADIFEALTARDRPYKPGKTLSETLNILGAMVEEGHVDADLHGLLLREEIHLDYAARHVAPEQIDETFHEALERRTAEWRPV